jgi:hypothetical protein
MGSQSTDEDLEKDWAATETQLADLGDRLNRRLKLVLWSWPTSPKEHPRGLPGVE